MGPMGCRTLGFMTYTRIDWLRLAVFLASIGGVRALVMMEDGRMSGLKHWYTFIVAIALAGFASSAHSDVIFSNLGPGDSFNVSSHSRASGLNRTSVGEYDVTGIGFTPQFDFRLDGVEIAGSRSGSPTSFSLRIAEGIFGGQTRPQPNETKIIEAINISSGVPGSAAVFTIQSADRPLLLSGILYWFYMVATDDDALFQWNNGDDTFAADTLPAYFGRSHGPNPSGNPWGIGDVIPGLQAANAIRVNGTPVAVSEPTTVAILTLGLLGLGLVRRRQKTA